MYPTKQTLRALRKRLPSGAIKDIAEQRGVSHAYISMVLSGARRDLDVVSDAIEVARKHEKRVANLIVRATN